MSGPQGRATLAVWRPRPRSAASPAWLSELSVELVDDGLATAAAAVVGDDRGVLATAVAGEAARGSAGEPLFDLASLTKPWMASLALRLDDRGLLPLNTELGELWPRLDERLAARTLEDLLRHRAGFQPWAPIYRRCRKPSMAAGLLLGGTLLGARRGTYSDLDYMLWALSAERALGRPLRDLLLGELVEPLGLAEARSGDTAPMPCTLGNDREVELAAAQGVAVRRLGAPAVGCVQDGNARFLRPPAGHAGLFATPRAMSALAREWLAPGTLWSAEANAAALEGSGPFLLGWRRPTKRGSGGPLLSPGSYGHIGFTGGSVWVDPVRRRTLVLLAHRSSVTVQLAARRRRFHSLALSETEGV